MGVTQAFRTWSKSRVIAKGQTQLAACPICGTPGAEVLIPRNNLAPRFDIDRRLTFSDYSLCGHCGGIFAARRETSEVAEAYYDLFPDIEERGYAKRVIPLEKRTGKNAVARDLVQSFEQRQMLRPGMSILHVRCDGGSLLAALRSAAPDATVRGLDYFPSNLEAARQAGFQDVHLLHPSGVQLPDDRKYDLIVSNHIFTHSLSPREDLQVLYEALAPGGKVFFYNENDHDLLFNPKSEYYTRMDVISYHKQLFTEDAFAHFLAQNGLQSELVERRKFTFSFLATKADEIAATPVSTSLAARRRMLVKWKRVADHNRYILPLAKWARGHKHLGWLAKKLQARTIGRAPKHKAPKASAA